jgi:hypothetical protein
MISKKSIILTLLIPAVFTAAAVCIWKVSKERLKTADKFQLKHENISVPLLPEWMPEDFTEIVLTVSGLNGNVSLFDKELPKKLSETFAADPWVESVESVVLRFPGGADVKLTYRRPATLVEVAPQKFMPVDKNGVLLPGGTVQKIEPVKLRSYPQITGIQTKPPERTGVIWNDPLVVSAAQLADILSSVPETGISKIIPKQEAGQHVFRLLTSANTEIFWGSFIPAAQDGKAHKSTENKIKRIQALIEQFGSLDGIPDSLHPVKLPE